MDDNEEFVELSKMIFGKEYVVFGKLDTENIGAALKEFKPDLIIIDHFIGKSDSDQVLAEIKNAIPDFSIPFILFSGSQDVKERAEKLGAVGYIEKPSSIDHIRTYIREILSKENR